MTEPGMDIHGAAQTRVKVAARRRLNLSIAGTGSPTVVFAPGLGSGTLVWAKVQPEIAKAATTVSYDPAGYGFSDPGPLPRDAAAMVRDLRAALANAGLAAPYVLVAHSISGLYMRLFAFQHPEEVAGLVMVDSSSEFQGERLFGKAGSKRYLELSVAVRRAFVDGIRDGSFRPGTEAFEQAMAPKEAAATPALQAAREAERLRPAFWRALNSEESALPVRSSGQVAAARRSLGDLPLIVLTALGTFGTAPGDKGAARGDLWRTMHAEIAALSSRGEQRLIDAGHTIQWEKPEPVIQAVTDVLEMVRAR